MSHLLIDSQQTVPYKNRYKFYLLISQHQMETKEYNSRKKKKIVERSVLTHQVVECLMAIINEMTFKVILKN